MCGGPCCARAVEKGVRKVANHSTACHCHVFIVRSPAHMISFNRPAMGMPSAVLGVTVNARPSGLGNAPSGSIPINSWMLPIRSQGYTGLTVELQGEGFVEKPDAATATSYLEGGRHFWNSGIFMFKASRWLELLGRFRADIAEACRIAERVTSG